MKFYVASKAKHGAMWQKYKSQGVHITSRWIDKWDQGTFPADYQNQHWAEILEDIHACDALVLYHKEGEVQKGALAEWGIAYGLGKQLFYVGSDNVPFTGLMCQFVEKCNSLEEVFGVE